MKAAVFREYSQDPKQVVKIEEVEVPKPGPGEAVLRVEAASYNYNDLWAIRGDPTKVPMPHVSGSDAAGVVTDVGDDVKRLKVGDRVVSHSNMSCRTCEMCASGREFDCPERKIWGFESGPLWGGFSQYTHLPEVNVIKLHDNVSFNDAAAVSMAGMTAWHALVGRARIHPGMTVLIMGGRSGVGTLGIQIAKLHECEVITTVGNDSQGERCRALGADYVINHRREDWFKKVRETTNKKGVDVIFEHIGQTHFPSEVGLLKMGGTLVTSGATTGYDSKVDLRFLFYKGTNLMGATQGTAGETQTLMRWVSRGKIKAVIDSVLPFSDMVEGHARMLRGDQFGKLLTTPQKL
ncbi:MAG TPA: zinc-binding dehydrogenase [Nitrososphaerales archaeon]|nr:zinc-binding dehydrogenase [Nitrososphaerales archaeon]